MLSPAWITKQPYSGEFPSNYAHLPRIVRYLLTLRGEWTDETLEQFLSPKLKALSDPFLLGEMAEAVERIFKAVDAGEEVILFGDYDVDGITSLTLFSRVLRAYGLDPHLIIPLRGKEGYGLTEKAVERAFKDKPAVTLFVAMDCGTSSVAEVQLIKDRGVDVLILDHHESNTGVRPACNAIVNPKACFTPTAEGDFSYLCAAGVVFKVCHALLKTRMLEDLKLKDLLDLVAIATVADIVPLVGENRTLVRHGLRALGGTNKAGLRALKEVVGVGDFPESEDIGYKIGPRINAAGRMDAPEDALAVMLTECDETAELLVARLNQYNVERQTTEKRILAEALEMIEEGGLDKHHCIIIGKEGWHPGVVGIVAARVMRKYFKPAFVIAFDEEGKGKGSGRSINGLSLVDAIEAGREHILAGGGHHAAAGISLSIDKLKEFQNTLNAHFEAETTAEQRAARLEIDAEVGLEELSMTFLESYNLLKPFGSKNPQPTFMSRGVTNTRPPRELKNTHLKLFLAQGGVRQEAIFFGGGAQELPPEPWDICYNVGINTFRGRSNLQLTIKHVRAAAV